MEHKLILTGNLRIKTENSLDDVIADINLNRTNKRLRYTDRKKFVTCRRCLRIMGGKKQVPLLPIYPKSKLLPRPPKGYGCGERP